MVALAARRLPKMRRRDAAHGLTASKRLQLVELGRQFSIGRERYLRIYWELRHVEAVLSLRSGVVERQRRSGWLNPFLSAHQNKVCMETALGIVRGHWQSTIRRAVIAVHRDAALGPGEKEMVLRTIRDPNRLQACLLGRVDRGSDRATRRLSARARRIVLKSRGRRPTLSRKLWFDLDCNLYRAFMRPQDRRFRGAWIAVTGLRPRDRVHVPLAGAGLSEFASRTAVPTSGPTIRVVISERVSFYVLDRVETKRRPPGIIGGLDKGFGTLLTLSTGRSDAATVYGALAAVTITETVERAVVASRQRRRIRAYERSIRNTDARKAKRMRGRNLGFVRSRRLFVRDRTRLRQLVDRSLNALFETEKRLPQLYCEDLTFRSTPIARLLNRRLGRWLKGYLHERLLYKAELNGVELTVVNAAYTSQSCPLCWFTSKANRRGEHFQCADCGYTGSADAVAATNVLRRGSDSAITRFMPPSDVKQILEGRWRSARNGRAWGSNEAVPASDALRDLHGGPSREQLALSLSWSASPHGGALSTPRSRNESRHRAHRGELGPP